MSERKTVYQGDGFEILVGDRGDISGAAESLKGYIEHCDQHGKAPNMQELADMYARIICTKVLDKMPIGDIIEDAVRLGYGFRVWEADQKEQAKIGQMLDDMAPMAPKEEAG